MFLRPVFVVPRGKSWSSGKCMKLFAKSMSNFFKKRHSDELQIVRIIAIFQSFLKINVP